MVKSSNALLSPVTPSAEKRSLPPWNPVSGAKAAASTHSTLPAAFAIHRHRSGEPYSRYSWEGGFSERIISGRCEISMHNPPVAGDMMISDRHASQVKFRSDFQNSMKAVDFFNTCTVRESCGSARICVLTADS